MSEAQDKSKTDDGKSRLTVGLGGNDILERLRRNTVFDCMAAAPDAAKEIETLRKSLSAMLFDLAEFDSDEDRLQEFKRLRKEARLVLTPNA